MTMNVCKYDFYENNEKVTIMYAMIKTCHSSLNVVNVSSGSNVFAWRIDWQRACLSKSDELYSLYRTARVLAFCCSSCNLWPLDPTDNRQPSTARSYCTVPTPSHCGVSNGTFL